MQRSRRPPPDEKQKVMDAYLEITAPDKETADKLEAHVHILAQQAGMSYERLLTLQHVGGPNPLTAAADPSGAPDDHEPHLDFDECVLAYFDSKKILTRFSRDAGFRLTRKHRPLIGRLLAGYQEYEGQLIPDEWISDKPEERAAQLFILHINDMVWRPLIQVMEMLETTEMGDPAHRDHFCDAFEAALRRDGLWHRKIVDLIRPSAT